MQPPAQTDSGPFGRALTRRGLLYTTTLAAAGVGMLGSGVLRSAGQQPPRRKMTIDLVCGAIGVRASQTEAIDLAHRHGFESVEARGDFLAGLGAEALAELQASLKAKGLVWGAAGLPVDFRSDEPRFEDGLKALPRIAAGLQRAGVRRMGTWITPAHQTLTYLQNFRQHARRLREVARVLGDHGLRLGLEYVGPKTSRDKRRFHFIHTLVETRELIAEIGLANVGFVLDSWHWWTAGETEADLLSLKPEQIVAVDLNDAPAGIPVDQQIDNQRELPMATGMIDLKSFLNTLNRLGYDGPVRAEPFNKALNDLDNEAACAATAQAMKKAFALLS